LQNFAEWQLKEICNLDSTNTIISAERAEHLGVLANQTKEMINLVAQHVENVQLVQEWMASFHRLHNSTSKRLQDTFIYLLKAANYKDPLWLSQAMQLCEVYNHVCTQSK